MTKRMAHPQPLLFALIPPPTFPFLKLIVLSMTHPKTSSFQDLILYPASFVAHLLLFCPSSFLDLFVCSPFFHRQKDRKTVKLIRPSFLRFRGLAFNWAHRRLPFTFCPFMAHRSRSSSIQFPRILVWLVQIGGRKKEGIAFQFPFRFKQHFLTKIGMRCFIIWGHFFWPYLNKAITNL